MFEANIKLLTHSCNFSFIIPTLMLFLVKSSISLFLIKTLNTATSTDNAFLLPYHFLKPVSFLGANRSKSASVGPRLLRGAI